MDHKNRNRIRELGFCWEELIDYSIGENIYSTIDEAIRRYYNALL